MKAPKSKNMVHNILSASVYGCKSPSPVDERVVNVKYIAVIYLPISVFEFRSYAVIKLSSSSWK